MPDERTYHVIADDKTKAESMTKEQILAAIAQAIGTGTISDVDTGFITRIRELNRNIGLKFWIGTTAEYNAIQIKETNCFYILTDDTELEDIETVVNGFQSEIDELADSVSALGSTVSDQGDEITALQTASETYADNFRVINAKKDWTILNQTVSYDDEIYIPLSMPHDEDLPAITIGDFRVVKVRVAGDEILCNVYKVSDSVCYIRGVSGGNASTSTLAITVINLKCSTDVDLCFLTQNHSIVYNPANNTKAGMEITKIVGVE